MKTISMDLAGAELLQAQNQTPACLMSYMITTKSGKIIVIDGGSSKETAHMRDLVRERGGKVDLWILTHCHYDHFQVLVDILNDPQGIEIGTLVYNLPAESYIASLEPHFAEVNRTLYAALEHYRGTVSIPAMGTVYEVDGVKIEILNDPAVFRKSPDHSPLATNDTTLVLRAIFENGKRFMVLADMTEYSSERMAEHYGADLKADILQLAHHGNFPNVSEMAYALIAPEIVLWPTVPGLYYNDESLFNPEIKGGTDTGPFPAVKIRNFLISIGSTQHYPSFEDELRIV